MINNLCMLFVGDGVKRRRGRVIRQYVRVKWSTVENLRRPKYSVLCDVPLNSRRLLRNKYSAFYRQYMSQKTSRFAVECSVCVFLRLELA
jgi:hypothetical protein